MLAYTVCALAIFNFEFLLLFFQEYIGEGVTNFYLHDLLIHSLNMHYTETAILIEQL